MVNLTGFPLYLLIFFGKTLADAVSTLRIIFVSKGRRLVGIAFGLFESLIGLLVSYFVLTGLLQDPFKIVVYLAAFGCGTLLGMTIERRMALGLSSMQVIVPREEADEVGRVLREAGFGVTILDGHSVDGVKRAMIMVQLRRSRLAEAIRIAEETCPSGVISSSGVESVKGGFLR